MSERFALIFSDGSMLILPESVDIQHARKEALSCDENEDNPLNFTMLAGSGQRDRGCRSSKRDSLALRKYPLALALTLMGRPNNRPRDAAEAA